ncbi:MULTISPECIES: alpha-amylase family glycosyl hydrolase [Streptomyces violaceusniger group]|uniref:alpha-amylase family glycosyl hydrolase n=1 Tax=Streptomyces violaceusniger group TaxID=2839105 RepID=UPI0023EA6CAD|nr:MULTISPECIES: alpha-amylase family glycosyl hydrolase [Streptomyces violaceusniger group]
MLVDVARRRGIRVILDPVPGHTSHRHPWFQESANTPGDDRYMREWIPNQGPRGGFYRANFFPIQPALNFGHVVKGPTGGAVKK